MEPSLQILVAIVAAASIPIVVYIYLSTRESSREARYQRLRDEIAKTLAYQIGEGRSLSAFEIRAVIDSKLRDFRVGPEIISVDEVVEDLVSETITTLMLDGQRKEQIIENLRRIHEQLIAIEEIRPVSEGWRPTGEGIATLFSWIAPVVTLVLFVGGAAPLQHIAGPFSQEMFLLYILLGVPATLISLFVAGAVQLLGRILGRRAHTSSGHGDAANRGGSAGPARGLGDTTSRLGQRLDHDAAATAAVSQSGGASHAAEQAIGRLRA